MNQDHCFRKGTEVEKKIRNRKPEMSLIKHRSLLAKTGFKDCADCPGTTGKLNDEGNMLCSNVNGKPVPITVVQAQQCDGTKPPPYGTKNERPDHKPHPIFRRPEHRT